MRSHHGMKLLLLTLFLFLTVPALAQRAPSSCPETAETQAFILSICDYGKGHTALPRARLFLRVYRNGSAEFETSVSKYDVRKHYIGLTPEQVQAIKNLGDVKEFRDLKSDYFDVDRNSDPGLDSVIIFRYLPRNAPQKRIALSNYHAVGDRDKTTRYPAALNALMKLADELRRSGEAATAIAEYNGGPLEIGKTYRGKVNFGDAYGMRLTPFPKLPNHHSVLYNWTNVKDFSALDPDKNFGVRTIVFKAVDIKVESLHKYSRTTTYSIEIIRVEE